MSKWTHAICAPCWSMRNPDRVIQNMDIEELAKEICCFCGKPTSMGIYVRANYTDLLCKGVHKGDTE